MFTNLTAINWYDIAQYNECNICRILFEAIYNVWNWS